MPPGPRVDRITQAAARRLVRDFAHHPNGVIEQMLAHSMGMVLRLSTEFRQIHREMAALLSVLLHNPDDISAQALAARQSTFDALSYRVGYVEGQLCASRHLVQLLSAELERREARALED